MQLNAVLLEAVASCSHKTLHYALLLGEYTWAGSMRNNPTESCLAPHTCAYAGLHGASAMMQHEHAPTLSTASIFFSFGATCA